MMRPDGSHRRPWHGGWVLLATADRMRLKFGTICLGLTGKIRELEPLERVWKHLSQEHKSDLIAQTQVWARRDPERLKKP